MMFRDLIPAPIRERLNANEGLIEKAVRNYQLRFSAPPSYDEYRVDRKFAIENWPAAVRTLSFRSEGFELSPDELKLVAQIAYEIDPSDPDDAERDMQKALAIVNQPAVLALIDRCNAEIQKFAEPPVFKLGTRSPKDSPITIEQGPQVRSGLDVIMRVMSSARIFQDVTTALLFAGNNMMTGEPDRKARKLMAKRGEALISERPWFWFREFAPLSSWSEVRCFMKDRAFMGATQYDGLAITASGRILDITAYPDLVERGYEYEAAIKRYFENVLLPATEGWCQGCVFDIAVDLDADKITLIEINPAGPGTFPGLFSWEDQSRFTGEFVWAGEEYLPDRRKPIHVDARDIQAQIDYDARNGR